MKKFLLLCLFSFAVFSGCRRIQPTSVTSTPVVEAIHISQQVTSPETSGEDSQIDAHANESALDVLKRTHTVVTKHFDFGDIVDEIDGIKGGTGGRYWIFYVNGKMAQVGAGAYKPQNGDKIVWKYQKENENL